MAEDLRSEQSTGGLTDSIFQQVSDERSQVCSQQQSPCAPVTVLACAKSLDLWPPSIRPCGPTKESTRSSRRVGTR